MEVKQIYEAVNNASMEALGSESLLQEDLSNLVDVGDAVFNASAFDRYVKSLVNQVGKMSRLWHGNSFFQRLRFRTVDANNHFLL